MVVIKRNGRVAKPSTGRKKIEIKKIDNKSSQQVTFSKRRAGLFKKASELCILCGTQIAIIVFSPVHKIFSFGHPSIEAVINRYLQGVNAEPHQQNMLAQEMESGSSNTMDTASIQALNQQYDMTMKALEMEKKRAADIRGESGMMTRLEFWWEERIDEETIEVEELEQYIFAIEDLMGRAAMKADDLMMRAILDCPFPTNGVPQNYGIGFGPQSNQFL
ncbi:hypothetical protein SAY86_007745 [Trapa natans]|uniref:MADS-box domain-containing protein n=1 Tax=Trapa natans TaxID=22666 RepID=A0AAN7LC68_TRANT|nr:hypothetical protein SAY86_007745 [Trapa natans]